MKFAMPNRWENFAFNEQNKEYLLSLKLRLKEELISGKKIYPPEKEIFKAFELTAPENTKVVILGQDPYHNFNQANGLCFSVNEKQLLPPSLKNIFKELEDDLGIKNYEHGDLSSWAKQGVLLMNTSLTVERGKPGSHLKFGWEQLTDQVIRSFNKKKNIVFMLWGKFAVKKKKLIDEDKHFILEASHPSPFSCHKGFFGCNHFSRCNNFLKTSGKKEINWKIT